MRVVAFANNRVGFEVVRWIVRSSGSGLVGLVLHPEDKRAYGEEILNASQLQDDRILLAPELKEEQGVGRLKGWRGEVGLSLYFGYILEPEVFGSFPERCLNLHPSYLPYNRGVYTNVWSIVDRTPAGASLHYIDEGVDTGPVLGRRRVEKRPTDTGETLYRRQEDACVDLFRDLWPQFVRGDIDPEPQPQEEGTYHQLADVEKIDRIKLDEEYTGRELLNRLRARTFPPYRGCYFIEDGQKIFLRLALWREEEYPPEDFEQHNRDGGGQEFQ